MVSSVFVLGLLLNVAASGASTNDRCEALFQSVPLDLELAVKNLVLLRHDIQDLKAGTHTALAVHLQEDFVKGHQDLVRLLGSEAKVRELLSAAELALQRSRDAKEITRHDQLRQTQKTLTRKNVPAVKAITPLSSFRLDLLKWHPKNRPDFNTAEIKDITFAPAGPWGVIAFKNRELILFHPALSEPVILRDSRGANDFYRFSPQGDYLLYGKKNRTFLLKLGFDGRITSQPFSEKLGQTLDVATSVIFSSDGRRASMWLPTELVVVDLPTGRVHRPVRPNLDLVGYAGDYVILHDRIRSAWVWNSTTALMSPLPQKLLDYPMGACSISAHGILIQMNKRRYLHVDPVSLVQTPIPGNWADVKLDPTGKYAMIKDQHTNEWSVLDMAKGMIIRQLGVKGFHAAWGPSGQMLIYDVLTYASTESLEGPVTVQDTPMGMSLPIWTAGPAISFQNTRQLHPPLSQVPVSLMIDAPMNLEWVSPWTHGALTAANPSRGGGYIILEPKGSKDLILHQAAHPKNDLIVPVTHEVAGKPSTSADDQYLVVPTSESGHLGFQFFKVQFEGP